MQLCSGSWASTWAMIYLHHLHLKPGGKPTFSSSAARLQTTHLVQKTLITSCHSHNPIVLNFVPIFAYLSGAFWRRKWQPTPVLLPGESHGQRSLAGYSPWGHKSQTRLSDLTTTITMQSLPCEMPGWMKHKLESRLPGEISITSDMQMTPPLWQKVQN